MTILLTGGAGYIGSHTAVELLSSGFDVVIADDYSNSCPLVIDRIEEISGKRPFVYELDVSNLDALNNIFFEHKIDAVIHFAGFKAVGESVKKPLEYYSNNLGCTVSVLGAMRQNGVKSIIFSSSATVYGDPETLPLCEDMKTGGCTNPYGQTKLMSEQIISDFIVAFPTHYACLLRYFNPVGAHESGLLGEDPKGIPNNLMPYISKVAVSELPQLNVFGNDYDTHDGTGVRDYIHVVDLAKGHVAALKAIKDKCGLDIYNLGTGMGSSVLDLVSAFESATGASVPYVITERREGDVAACYASADKAFRELGWRAELTVSDMCRDSWNFQSKNPQGYNG